MPWGVVAAVGGALIGADAAKSAANAQSRSADQATQEQRRQYDQTRTDLAPWRAAGAGALNRLSAASTGDMSSFQASPDYNFVRSEGQRDMGNTFAARGGAFSGNALRALDQYNQQLAQGQFGNWWSRQANLAGLGQDATNTTAVAGQNAANQISGNYLAAGNARASGIAGQANAWGSALGNIGGYAAYQGWGNPFSRGGGSFSNNYGIDPGWGSGANTNNALALQGFG